MSAPTKPQLVEEIMAWKKKRNALILAHNYQTGDIQDIADLTGDSLLLSQRAAANDAEVILFAGVHFMAETASILSPQKKVIIPDVDAGCSLADMVKPEDIRAWREKNPDGVVVCYVNTTAAVKAECDYCCTSSNAERVVRAIPADKKILFVPDHFLGSYVKAKTGRENIELWRGYCLVHMMIQANDIEKIREQYPDAEVLVHPECASVLHCIQCGYTIASTEGMIRRARESQAKTFIVATEPGILHRLQKENPGKTFLPAVPDAICCYMKVNTLEKMLAALKDLWPEVKVPKALADRARLCIQRMLEIS
ncbi:MAG: quinolinate synthase NadA [Candidatus Omnitrophota bacterium]